MSWVERVVCLEEKTALKHIIDTTIEHLEMNLFGDINTINEPISRRIKALESAFFDEE